MQESLNMVREAARAIGLELPEEREQSVAHALETALKQADAVRATPNPVPEPAPFDASWSKSR